MRVLVAEDEQRVAEAVARGLRREGLAVDVTHDGRSALEKTRLNPYDVLVLDRDLPELHGDEVACTVSAEAPQTRVLMLTAYTETDDVIDGLRLGADDYVSKPFDFRELVARIRALARRAPDARPPVLVHGDVRLDPGRRTVERAGRPLELTPKEFGVLEVLLDRPGTVISAERLLYKVWDENADPFTNTVRMTVMTLRRKLGDPAFVHTVKGAGYRV